MTDALLNMREHGFALMEPDLEAVSSYPISAVSDDIGKSARKSSHRVTRDFVSKPNAPPRPPPGNLNTPGTLSWVGSPEAIFAQSKKVEK